MIYFCDIFVRIIYYIVVHSEYTNNKHNNSKAPLVFTIRGIVAIYL